MTERESRATKLLEEVLGQLDRAVEDRRRELAGRSVRDGIDRQLARVARGTRVRSVRGSRAAERFKRELEEESIKAATVVGFLRLLRRVLSLL